MRRLVLPILLSLLFASCINKNNYAEARYEIPIANYDIEEIYLERSGYSTSFNPITNIPNWVAWTLNQEKLILLICDTLTKTYAWKAAEIFEELESVTVPVHFRSWKTEFPYEESKWNFNK